MKIHTYIALGAFAWIGLTSCETRESLVGGDVVMKEGYGALELLVTAKEPVETKAVSTTKFPVIIAEKESEEVVEEYTVGTLPETILLPVGDYTVTAHSSAELEKRMESPYYEGSADLAIANGVTKQTTVTCTQKNSRVRLEYEDDFLTTFKEWLVTIDDGSESVLVYTHEDGLSPRDVYYLFDDKVKSIVVNVSAKTTAGETVAGNYRFTKADAPEGYEGDTEYFTGGDALVVKLTALSLDAPTTGEVNQIGVTVNVSFANSNTSVIIPVEDLGSTGDEPGTGDEDDNPSQGGDGAVTLTFPKDITIGSYGAGIPSETVNVNIKTPNGLAKMNVRINGGNDDFDDILHELRMDGQSFKMDSLGCDVVDNKDFDALLKQVDPTLAAPSYGVDEYDFPISFFFSMLTVTGATDEGKAHEFYIDVTDKLGNKASGIYKVTIYQEEDEE